MKDKSSSSLVGQFCRRSDGERVFVESLVAAEGGMPERAIFRYIEGQKEGDRGSCFVSSLEPLGYEIPRDENLPPEAA
jgi:hypothetical protein